MEHRDESPTTAALDPPAQTGSLARAVMTGAGASLVGASVVLVLELVLSRGRTRISDLSWPLPLVGFPILGAVVGGMSHRNPETRTRARGITPPADDYATGPVSAEAREARLHRIRKSVWTGFSAGVVAALAASAVDFAVRGWPFVGQTLSGCLILLPLLGAGFGFNLGQRRGDPKPSLQDARFGMRTLMILTAYLALLIGFGMRVSRTSTTARWLHAQSLAASQSADFYREILANDHAKRASKPPQPSLAPQTVEVYRRMVEYQEQLAEKYARAAQTPWLPVAPDPPPPR